MGHDEKALVRLWKEKRGEIGPEDLSGNLIVQLGLVRSPSDPHHLRFMQPRAFGRRVSAGAATRAARATADSRTFRFLFMINLLRNSLLLTANSALHK
jgi:hypothetical protein